MAKEKPIEQMTGDRLLAAKTAEAEIKAAELSAKYGVRVHAMVFKSTKDNDVLVGYFKEPRRDLKFRIMDAGETKAFSVCDSIYPTCVIQEETDARLYSEAAENDNYYMGAVLALFNACTVSINQFKKK